MTPETEATTEPLTLDDIKAAIKKMEDEPPRLDYYEDSPEMRRALGIGGDELEPVERCEHGKIDAHVATVKPDYDETFVAYDRPCPGAGIGGDE